jgi:hypothetical protein
MLYGATSLRPRQRWRHDSMRHACADWNGDADWSIAPGALASLHRSCWCQETRRAVLR